MSFVLRFLGAASFCTRGQAVGLGVEPAEVSFLWACEQSLRLLRRLDIFPQEHSVSCLSPETCSRSKYSRRVVKRRLTIGYATEMQDATNKSIGRAAAGMQRLSDFHATISLRV
jgi:hypothetical protein